jgi:hypothetical protein
VEVAFSAITAEEYESGNWTIVSASVDGEAQRTGVPDEYLEKY